MSGVPSSSSGNNNNKSGRADLLADSVNMALDMLELGESSASVGLGGSSSGSSDGLDGGGRDGSVAVTAQQRQLRQQQTQKQQQLQQQVQSANRMKVARSVGNLRTRLVDQQEEALAEHLEVLAQGMDALFANQQKLLALSTSGGVEQAGLEDLSGPDVFRREMNGFKDLFARFKETRGNRRNRDPSKDRTTFVWEAIRPPPADAVVEHAALREALPDPLLTQHELLHSGSPATAAAAALAVPALATPAGDVAVTSGTPESTELLSKLAVVKLNGGLGTTMGCRGPKSAIEVHSGLTFLDLTVNQIEHLEKEHDVAVPLLLMNSFNTHAETLEIIAKYRDMADVRTFRQSRFPRISANTMLPVAGKNTLIDNELFYPPGHGDVFRALENSGLLDELLAQDKEFMFLSNIDNLGATVDLAILNYMANGLPGGDPADRPSFLMEVTPKTRNDVKGGTLISYTDPATRQKSVRLFELAQCPSDHVEDFTSLKKFKIFNTNNLWINLRELKAVLASDGLRDMEVIVNRKNLQSGTDVIQLETAAGSAIRFFPRARGVVVDRARFLPVKSTSDLLLVQSNLYLNLKHGYLLRDPRRDEFFGLTGGESISPLPTIKLGDFFVTVGEFQRRFSTIPDIIELEQLTIAGDVHFGRGVVLRGTVIIVANTGERIDIPSGSILSNKVISGHLRILDY